MQKNKKILLVLASVVLAGALVGCNVDNSSSSETPSSSEIHSSSESSSGSSSSEHAHSYGDWTLTTEPTTTTTGVATRTCVDSDDTETTIVPVLTDTSVWSVKSSTADSCEAAGKTVYTSTLYGDVTVNGKAKGHAYGPLTVTKEPTLTEKGSAKQVCANDASHVITEDVPALSDNNTWSVKSEKAPTCTEAGNVVYTSTKYGDVTITVSAKDHAYGEWSIVTAPTATTVGSAKQVCANDNEHVETKELPVLTDTSVWTAATTPAKCGVAGKTVYTSIYGEVTVEIPALEHDYSAWKITTAPTISEDGVITRVCSHDSTHVETKTIKNLNDASFWSVDTSVMPVMPTLTTPGSARLSCEWVSIDVEMPVLTDTSFWKKETLSTPGCTSTGQDKYSCNYPGAVVIIDTEATGHLDVTHVEGVEPTCEETGVVEHWICNDCGNIYSDEALTNQITLADTIIPATDHAYGDWALDIEPTATEGGLASRICSNDSSHIEEKEVPAITDTSVWEVVSSTDPTYDAKGSITVNSIYGTVTVEVPELEDSSVWTVSERVEPTCDVDGHVTFTSAIYGEITCKLAALDHDYGEWSFEVEPTEDAAGKAIKVCSNGDHPIEIDVPALTDTSFWSIVEDESTEPGCGVEGKVVYENNENHLVYVKTLGALSHSGEWEITLTPTETTAGTISRVCANCDTPEEIELPSLSTTDAYEVITVAPTASTVGTKTFKYVTPDNQEINIVRYLYLITESANYPFARIDHRESNTFVDDGTGIFTSNNAGKNSSGAYMDIFFSAKGTLTFDYVISSESGWDKGNIYYRGGEGLDHKNIVSNISGDQSGSKKLEFAGDVAEYNYVYFQYNKDSGGNSGSDNFTISNIVFETDVKLEKCSISFDTNGGSQIDSITPYIGGTIVLPENPTKDNAFFAGWYLDDACTEAFDASSYVVSGDDVLYAKWVAPVKLSFNTNGGEAIADIEGLEPNTEITMPNDPVKENAYFAGWYIDEACTEGFNPSNGIAEDTTIYAKWREPVTLQFATYEGSEIASISTDINVAIEEPTAPIKENHRFDGWYTDSTYTTLFDFSVGIAENTIAHAKWVEVVSVTIYSGSDVIVNETIDKGSEYFVELPSDFTSGKNIKGIYTDAEFQNAYVNGTVIDTATVLYVDFEDLLSTFAPSGVVTEFVNNSSDGSTKTSYEWTITPTENGATFVSSNKGISNSYSGVKFVLGKQSILTFDYLVSSESNYDYLIIKVNSTEVVKTKVSGSIEVSANFIYKLEAGDVVEIYYTKDSSGNQNDDTATLTNLKFSDGYPTSTITYVYNDGVTENGTGTVDYASSLTVDHLQAPTNVRDEELYIFDGWYLDENFELEATTDTLVNSESITLYAHWLEKVTVSFVVPEGVTAIEDVNVWTNTLIDIETPTLDGHIFRGWYLENSFVTFVDLANGVEESVTLYAMFESLPAGSTKEEAVEIVLEDGSFTASGTTTEEFENYYFSITPEVDEAYYFTFDPSLVANKEFGPDKPTYVYPSDGKFNVVDSEGNTILSDTGFNSTPTKVVLEGGKTYYIAARLGSSYHAWGDFGMSVCVYDNDVASEAIAYTFGETVTIQNQFASRYHKLVYSFTTDETMTGDYVLTVDGTGWSSVYIYSNEELSTTVASVNHAAGNPVSLKNVKLEANKTYYVVVSNNWTGTDLTTKTAVFAIKEYGQGYIASNPLPVNVEETIDVVFTGGFDYYVSFDLSETATYKFDINGGTSSSTKQVYVYSADDLSNPVHTLTSAVTESVITYANLGAGSYVIKANYSSTSYTNTYTLDITKAAAGESNINPIAISLPAEDGNIEGISSLSSNGTYYSFTTEASLWNFFTASDSTATIKILTVADGVETVVKEGTGTVYAKLDAETNYVLYIKSSSDVDSASVAHSTLTEFRDGTSADSAFIVSVGTTAMDMSTVTSYTVWYQITVEEAGSYSFCTNNNGSVDTKGWLYSASDTSSQLAYNDDYGVGKDLPTGYKYDFGFIVDLEAGTYVLKVTYSIYSSNTATELNLNVIKN